MVTDLQGGAVAGGGHAHHGLLGEIDKLFTLQSSKLHLFAIVILAYAAVEGIEAVGLWYQRRWAEYLTFLVTASLLPLEVYELANRLSPLKILAFVINVAVVAYLLYAKRLFGLRGGARADEEIREQRRRLGGAGAHRARGRPRAAAAGPCRRRDAPSLRAWPSTRPTAQERRRVPRGPAGVRLGPGAQPLPRLRLPDE